MTPTDETFETHDNRTTMRSSRFRETTHLIPSPGLQGHKTFEPLMLKLPVVIGTPLLMLGLGIGLEVAVIFSNKYDGFKMTENNVFNVIGDIHAQTLASFLPPLLISLFALTWKELDWNLRSYQPYMVLQKGNAVAEESVLLDYISLGPFLSLFRAMEREHRVIFWSSFTAILTYTFRPLTAPIFQIRPGKQYSTTNVTRTKSFAQAPDFSTLDGSILNGIMAAAGYVDGSVSYGLGDPPFVQRNWATAEVTFPEQRFPNATLTVNTYGIQSNVTCSNPSETPVLTPAGGTNLILSSISIDGCPHSKTFDPNHTTYGVDSVLCPGDAAPLDAHFQPVMFWYYHMRDSDGSQEVKTVFCTPSIAQAEVQIIANMDNGGLVSCHRIGDATQANNDINGTNGLIFDSPSILAQVIPSIVPGAVYRAAQLLPNGSQSVFDLPNGFLDLTSTLYTRHLSLTAKAIYFVDENTTLPANVVSLVPRLKIDELPAHLLALILATTGIIGIFLHIIHRGARKRLLLATPPGSIASVVALTSRSGFGELLLPYDDELTLEKKLDGLRFRLDRRTGAILADDHVREGTIADEAMLALFGEERAETMDMNHSAVESLSLLASQAASQSLRWQRSWVPAELSPLQQHSNTPRQAASVSGQPKPVQHGRGRLKKSAGSENVKPASQQVFAGVVLGKWNPTDQAASEPPVEEGDKDGDGEVDEESEDPILTAINGNGNEDLSSLGESNKENDPDFQMHRSW